MQPLEGTRMDLIEVRAQIVKKIGVEKSRRYFYYLSRFLSQKLSKSELDKACHRLLGRENLHLHNLLLRSIMKNACQSKTPPPLHQPIVRGLPSREDGLSSLANQNQHVLNWPNGALPASPRKSRSDRKLKDKPSPLGPNGKVEDFVTKVNMANGHLSSCDYQRPLQCQQEPAIERGLVKSRSLQIYNKDGENVEEKRSEFCKSPLVAPLGIPFCPASVGGACKATLVPTATFYDSGGLSDTETLMKRMEQIASANGLEGVSMEGANMLNNMLDLYLKRLINSCIGLVRPTSGQESETNSVHKQQHIQSKVINGMWTGLNNNHMPLDAIQQNQRPQTSITLHDFKVAMEMNPQQLGGDWPLLLEKICMNSFKE